MFSLKIKVFSIILLSVIFTGEEIAKDSTTHIMFKKYSQTYYNLPYHTYFLFPKRRQEHFFESRVSNLDFFMNLSREVNYNNGLALPFVYFFLFFKLIYRSFERGKIAKGFFFLTTSVFNILSLVFIPQYVLLIGKYSSYKGLLRLNLETGFYLSNDSKEIECKLKTLDEQQIDVPTENKDCVICQETLWENNDKEQAKKTVTALKHSRQDQQGKKVYFHYFHTRCIAPWLKKDNASCPLCREAVDINYYLSKGEQQDYMVGNGDLTQAFFGKRNFFSMMMYADVTLCIDNFDIVVNDPYETYWFVEMILLRLGTQINSPSFSYTFHPFIGFCGISIRFHSHFILSLVPTYMIKDSLSIYPGEMLLDIQLTINFVDTSFYA